MWRAARPVHGIIGRMTDIVTPLACTGPAPVRAARLRLAYVSPTPPARTGIAGYSAALVPALRAFFRIELIDQQAEPGRRPIPGCGPVRDADWLRRHASQFDLVLYQFGNSGFHDWMLELLRAVPGVVVLHDFFLGGLFDALARQPGGAGVKARALFHAHGYPPLLQLRDDPAAVNARYPCNLAVLGHARGVLVHSAESQRLARRWLGEQGGRGWWRLPLAREVPRPVSRRQARAALGLAQDAFVVCSFGLLAPTKLNHRLLEAWLASDLAGEPLAQLRFVGAPADDDYVQRLRDRASHAGRAERMTVTGWVDDATYALYLAAADVAVQLRACSRGESSAAVLDCMGHGLPTIVNAHGSMAELPAAAVLQMPDRFVNGELVAALEHLRADARVRRELGERARAFVARDHAPARCAQACHQALQAIHAAVPGADSLAMLPRRQLLVDVSATCQASRITGIERVAHALLREWLADADAPVRIEPVYLKRSGGQWQYHYARAFGAALMNIEAVSADELVRFSPGDHLLALDICAGPLVEAQAQGLYERLRQSGVSCRVMIHDVLPAIRPELFPASMRPHFLAWLDAVLGWDAAICVTHAARVQLRQWLREHRPERAGLPVHCSWHGADFSPAGASQGEWREPWQGSGPTVLMVGTLEPRKGHLQALQACSLLWQAGVEFNLLLVGAEGWQGIEASERGPVLELLKALRGHAHWQRRLFWLEDVDDQQLATLYARADGLLAASWDEGFGLPLIEAARFGLPALARDIPVFREVTGGRARFFQAGTPGELARALRLWLADGMMPRPGATYWPGWEQSAARLIEYCLAEPRQ